MLEDDLFGQKRKDLERWIRWMKHQGLNVYIHHPQDINGGLLHINSKESIIGSYFELSTRILVEISEKYDCYTVVHWNYGADKKVQHQEIPVKESYSMSEIEFLVEKTEEIDRHIGKGRILWENPSAGIGAYRDDFVLAELIAQTSLSLTFDTSHAFISLKGNNNKLEDTIKLLEHNIAYYHVVDSMGLVHDSLPLGDGRIDFARLKPYIIEKDFIYEIDIKNINDAREAVASHHYFTCL